MSDPKVILIPNNEQYKTFVSVQQSLVHSLEMLIESKVETLKDSKPEYKLNGLSQAAMLSKEREWLEKIGLWSSVSISSQDFQKFYFTFGIGEHNLSYIFTALHDSFDGIQSLNGAITFSISHHNQYDDVYNTLIEVLKPFGTIYTLDSDKTLNTIHKI